jgi:hypothetical protein
VPKFFFHLYDDMVALDEEGIELRDAEAARDKALADARHMACAEVLEGRLNLSHRIEVVDERGDVLLTVPFGATVKIES